MSHAALVEQAGRTKQQFRVKVGADGKKRGKGHARTVSRYHVSVQVTVTLAAGISAQLMRLLRTYFDRRQHRGSEEEDAGLDPQRQRG